MFFQLLSTIKVNLVAKIMQSAYLCVIFHVKHKKITISRGFNLIFNSWYNPRWRLIVGDVTGLQQRHHPKIYLILLRRSKGFHRRLNCFKLLQHSKNSGERFHPPPSPLYHGWGRLTLIKLRC